MAAALAPTVGVRIHASTQTPPSITIPQTIWEGRAVEAPTDTAKTLTSKSWLNTAAHIAAYHTTCAT